MELASSAVGASVGFWHPTFNCPMGCAGYCKRPLKTDFLFKLSDLYPGLTPAERALVSEYPDDSVSAFKLSLSAERLCLRKYPQSKTNDESDACRHFVWAALMTGKLGSEMAVKFLNAHEEDSKQPKDERSMDLANNRAGVIAGERLKKTNELSEESVMKLFDKSIRSHELVIMKSRGEAKKVREK